MNNGPENPTTVTSLTGAVTVSGFCLIRSGHPDFCIDSDIVTVGAASDSDLVMEDPGVSRSHFRIEKRPEGWLLVDQNSTNGTMVDRARVSQAWLKSGMEIRIGRTVMEFRAVSDFTDGGVSGNDRFGGVIGTSPAMKEIFDLLEKVAPTDATVLIEGETGSGKEVVARSIHEMGGRAGRPFVVFDCGATPRELVESILFGHERGAFTGAVTAREGLFEQADGGTLFLDELGELPLDMQPRLLRILETRQVRRVGATRSRNVDVRILAATNRSLQHEVSAGRFRADLFFRLAVIRVRIPALRDRKQDVAPLVRHFLETRRLAGRDVPEITERAVGVLSDFDWPGNVRELFNALERSVSLCDGDTVDVPDLPGYILDAVFPSRTGQDGGTADFDRSFQTWAVARDNCLNRFEKEYLSGLMEKCGGNITVAARCADLDRKHLRNLLKKHGLHRSPDGGGDVSG